MTSARSALKPTCVSMRPAAAAIREESSSDSATRYSFRMAWLLRSECGGFAACWTAAADGLSSVVNCCGRAAMSGRIDGRLKELGVELPEPTAPLANYVPFAVTGNLVFIAGQICMLNGERRPVGKLGAGISVADGRDAARLCALNILTHLRVACGGDLDRVRRCVQLRGFVNCTPEFTDMPQVVNGASDLMVEIFGDIGRHARAA